MIEDENYKCVKVLFSDYAEEIGILRRKAWETVNGFDPVAFPEGKWIDELDKNAIHWAVFDHNKIIASARLGIYNSHKDIPYIELIEPYKTRLIIPVASLNRLVVSPDYRSHHISHLLDKIRIEEAKKNKAKTVIGQAVSNRLEWLQSLGFEFIADIGSIKELPNIKLSLMIKNL
jgi:predicted GNAT family N-acyltransferase